MEIDCNEARVFKIEDGFYQSPTFLKIKSPEKLKPKAAGNSNISNFEFAYKDVKTLNDINNVIPAVLSHWHRVTFKWSKKFENGEFYKQKYPNSVTAKHYETDFFSILNTSIKSIGDFVVNNISLLTFAFFVGLAILCTLGLTIGCCQVCCVVGCSCGIWKVLGLICWNILMLFWHFFMYFLRYVKTSVKAYQPKSKRNRITQFHNDAFDLEVNT